MNFDHIIYQIPLLELLSKMSTWLEQSLKDELEQHDQFRFDHSFTKATATQISLSLDSKFPFYIFQGENEDLAFVFYFMFEGMHGTFFENGHYIGKFIVPKDYPTKKPAIHILTPSNGLVLPHKYQGDFVPVWIIKGHIIPMLINFYEGYESETKVDAVTDAKTKDRAKHCAKHSVKFNQDHYPEIWQRFKKMQEDEAIRNKLFKQRLDTEMKELTEHTLSDPGFPLLYQDEECASKMYFMIKGFRGTCFENGRYIGVIELSKDYPRAFGEIYLLTPNGKLRINENISPHVRSSGSIKTTLTDTLSLFYDEASYVTESWIHTKVSDPDETIRESARNSVGFNARHYPKIWEKFNSII